MADEIFVDTQDPSKAAITGIDSGSGTGDGVVGKGLSGAGIVGRREKGEALRGETESPNSAAINGQNNGEGNGAGVVGISATLGTGAGVVGISKNIAGAGVIGQGKIAGQFEGDVAINGALRIGGVDVARVL